MQFRNRAVGQAEERERGAVPEFDGAFETELREADGELGEFQAMSLFANWMAERLRLDEEADPYGARGNGF